MEGICIPVQIKNRAFNQNIEEVQSNDDLWAEITLQHVCEDKELACAVPETTCDFLPEQPEQTEKIGIIWQKTAESSG